MADDGGAASFSGKRMSLRCAGGIFTSPHHHRISKLHIAVAMRATMRAGLHEFGAWPFPHATPTP